MNSTPWICVLEAIGYGRLVLNGQGDNNLPDGWAEKKVSIKRSPTYFGLNRMVSTSLQFVTNGKDYIQRIYENEGTEFVINIAWFEYQELPIDKYFLFFAGLVDLGKYKFEELMVTCDVNESNIARKFMSRDDVKVNLSALESIEGVTLPANKEVTVVLRQRELLATVNLQLNEGPSSVESTVVNIEGTDFDGFTLPIELKGGDDGIDNIANQDTPILGSPNGQFWQPSGQESIATFTGRIVGRARDVFAFSGKELAISFRLIIYTDNTLTDIDFFVPLATNIIIPQPQSGQTPPFFDFDFTFDAKLGTTTLITDTAVIGLIAIDVSTASGNIWEAEFTTIDLRVSQNLQFTDGTEAQGYLMHEVGQRISEVIFDKEDIFKSNFLGRTDIGYPVDGKGAFQTVHSGKQIRTIPNEHPAINFRDWFQSENSMHNLGAGIEHDEFNAPFLRVEEKEHFFSGNVTATIHSVSNISKTVAREWIYNEVEVGYPKITYEEINGQEEYNNTFEWATSIRTIKNKLDLTSKLVAGGYPIEFARRLGLKSEDSKYDKENFTVIVKPISGKFTNVQDENYDIVENIFSPKTAYNLDITPGRMLRNNGSVIRAGLEHYLTDPLKFQDAQQQRNLKSQRTGEAAITENEDIDVSTLSPGLWIPEIFSFDSVLTREQLAAITKNQNGIIKFSTTTVENTTKYYYGWILSVEVNTGEDNKDWKATWELLRVNLESPDVKLVDPEGSTPGQDPDIIDPSNIFGIFEGPFEFIFSG